MLRYAIVIGLLCGLEWFLGANGARAAESDADQKLTDLLDRKIPEINFTGQGLADVLDFMRDVSGANIFVNWRALEAAGIAKDAKVDLQLKDVKLRDSLQSILDKAAAAAGKATFTVADGIIFISTPVDPKHPRAGVSVIGIPAKRDRKLPEINFNGQRLADVIDFLQDVSGVKFSVDWAAMEQAGAGKDAAVVARVRDMKMSTVVRVIFESASDGVTPISCTYVGDAMKVTATPPEKKDAPKAGGK